MIDALTADALSNARFDDESKAQIVCDFLNAIQDIRPVPRRYAQGEYLVACNKEAEAPIYNLARVLGLWGTP